MKPITVVTSISRLSAIRNGIDESGFQDTIVRPSSLTPAQREVLADAVARGAALSVLAHTEEAAIAALQELVVAERDKLHAYALAVEAARVKYLAASPDERLQQSGGRWEPRTLFVAGRHNPPELTEIAEVAERRKLDIEEAERRNTRAEEALIARDERLIDLYWQTNELTPDRPWQYFEVGELVVEGITPRHSLRYEKAVADARHRHEVAQLVAVAARRAQLDAWVAEHCTELQKQRYAEGFMPDSEIEAAIEVAAFASVDDCYRICDDLDLKLALGCSDAKFDKFCGLRDLLPTAALRLMEPILSDDSISQRFAEVEITVGTLKFKRFYHL